MGSYGDGHSGVTQVEGKVVKLCVTREVISKPMGVLGKVYCFDRVDRSQGGGLDRRGRTPARVGFDGQGRGGMGFSELDR